MMPYKNLRILKLPNTGPIAFQIVRIIALWLDCDRSSVYADPNLEQ